MALPPHSTTLADAVHHIQLSLLDGVATFEGQLLAAGTLLSRPDYDDVVVERSLAGLCGHPLCTKALSNADTQQRRGRYRIALREHRVYDLEETYKYCSQSCLVSSRAFAESLERERMGDVSLKKVDRVLREFRLGKDKNLPAENGLVIRELKIKEKEQVGNGDASMEDWLGPSDAIEGYVPMRDRKQGAKFMSEDESTKMVDDAGSGEMGFTSCVIMGNEFFLPQSDKSSVHQQDISNMIAKQLENVVLEEKRSQRERSSSKTAHRKTLEKVNACKTEEKIKMAAIVSEQSIATLPNKSSVVLEDPLEQLGKELEERLHLEKETVSNEATLKSSLKTGGSKDGKTVTWADETYKATEKKDADHGGSSNAEVSHDDVDEDLRLASAEACAAALVRAAETVASGTSDATDAVSEAGIIILPQPHHNEKRDTKEDEEMFEVDQGRVKWPTKPVLLDIDMFEVEDSWHDTPPESFKLTLSSFATMWMTFFGWITSSSIAYIYGYNESSHEDFLTVNGMEYPRKIVLKDGKSSEIRQTLDICVGRAIPGLVMDLRLSSPVSSLETAMGQLLDTMSLTEAVPAFRTKQWHVIVLLFLEALSLHRLPTLARHMANRNTLLHKVLNPAQITSEEYETMVDLILPLGRLSIPNKVADTMIRGSFLQEAKTDQPSLTENVTRIWKLCEADPHPDECLAAIEAWGKLSHVENAEKIFDDMMKTSKMLSSKYYNALLNVYANQKLLSKGKELAKRMSDNGSRIGPLTWDVLVRMYAESGEVEQAELILEKAAAQRSKIKPLYNSYMILLGQYAKEGNIHNAQKIFLRLRKIGRMRQYQSLSQAYINAKTPASAYGFREKLKADKHKAEQGFCGAARIRRCI